MDVKKGVFINLFLIALFLLGVYFVFAAVNEITIANPLQGQNFSHHNFLIVSGASSDTADINISATVIASPGGSGSGNLTSMTFFAVPDNDVATVTTIGVAFNTTDPNQVSFSYVFNLNTSTVLLADNNYTIFANASFSNTTTIVSSPNVSIRIDTTPPVLLFLNHTNNATTWCILHPQKQELEICYAKSE